MRSAVVEGWEVKLKPWSAEASAAYREGYLAGISASRQAVQKVYEMNVIISRQIEEVLNDETDDKPDLRAEQSP